MVRDLRGVLLIRYPSHDSYPVPFKPFLQTSFLMRFLQNSEPRPGYEPGAAVGLLGVFSGRMCCCHVRPRGGATASAPV